MTKEEEIVKQQYEEQKALVEKLKLRPVTPPRKPKGFSRFSNASYYTKEYGTWIKAEIDRLLAQPEEGRQDVLILMSSYPTIKRFDTLYLRVYHALRYLYEQMDPDGYYSAVRNRIRVMRHPDRLGILIHWINEHENNLMPGVLVDPPEMKSGWRQRLEKFFEEAQVNDVFYETNLTLTLEDMAWINSSFETITNFVLVKIGRTVLKVMRVE